MKTHYKHIPSNINMSAIATTNVIVPTLAILAIAAVLGYAYTRSGTTPTDHEEKKE